MRITTGEQLREVAAALKQDRRNYLHEVEQGKARIAELEAELAATVKDSLTVGKAQMARDSAELRRLCAERDKLKAKAAVPDGMILVDKRSLGTVLQALVNAPHHIRELQATREPAALFKDNPINVLIANYEAATAQPPSQGGEAVEVVASIAVDAEGVVRDFTLEPGLDRHAGGYTVTSLMTVAQHKRIMAAQQGSAKEGEA